MYRVANHTHPGGSARNEDAARIWQGERCLYVSLCDGMGGTGGGALAAAYCADGLLAAMQEGAPPEEAMLRVRQAYEERQKHAVELRSAKTTACALALRGGACAWANIGDSRLYHFSAGRLLHRSVDDSAAYQEYEAGGASYASLRLHPRRSILTACLGDEKRPAPHTAAFTLLPGDGLLLCSDGFWQYVFETEMEMDFCKSASPEAWQEAMLLRIARRSYLQGDNLTVVAIVFEGGSESEF